MVRSSLVAVLLFASLPARSAVLTLTSQADFDAGTHQSTRSEGSGDEAWLALAATASGSWSPVASPTPRLADLTWDGSRYLYALAFNASPAFLARYDTVADSWAATSVSPDTGGQTINLIARKAQYLDGRIYVPMQTAAGGYLVYYDVGAASWVETFALPASLSSYELEGGLDGKLYYTQNNALYRYDPVANSSTLVANSFTGCIDQRNALAQGLAGEMYVLCPAGLYRWSLANGARTSVATTPDLVTTAARLTFDGANRLYAQFESGRVYTLRTDQPAAGWSRLADMPDPQCANEWLIPGLVHTGGTSLYAHGTDCGGYAPGMYRFDIVSDYAAAGSYSSAALDTGGLPDYSSLYWSGSTPAGTSAKLQIATSPSAAGPWSFVGPDGTATTYYTVANGTAVPASHDGQRFARFAAYLDTADARLSPQLFSVSLGYLFRSMAVTTPSPLPEGRVGVAYTRSLLAEGGIAPLIWAVSADAPPDGLSLSSGGVLSGTPTTAGNVSFTVQVVDSGSPPASATKRFALNINPPLLPPVIDESATLSGAVGAAYGYDLDGAASASGTTPLTWSLSAGPAAFNINPATGVVTWTPTASGAQSITLTAQNDAGSDSYTFVVQVDAAPTPPVVQATANGAASVGLAYRYDADNSASATGTPPISWSVLSGPAELLIDAASGFVQWTPAAAGRVDIVIRASNAAGSYSYSFSVDVAPAPTAPLIDETAALTAELGRAYVYDADGRASAQGTAPVSWALVSGPTGFAIDAQSGAVSWQPVAVGAANVSLLATNIAGSDTYAFTVMVSTAPSPPVIQPTASLTAMTGVPYHYDSDDSASAGGTPPISWSVVIGPMGLTIDAASGLVEWTPDAPGLVDVVLRATNAAGSYDYAFVVDVADMPTPPAIDHSANLVARVGEAYAYDADGYAMAEGTLPIVWSLLAAPAGFAVDTTTGLITWMPAVATDAAVTLKATNAAGSDTYSFVIAVSGAACAQTAATPSLLEPADGATGVSTRFDLRWWPVFGAESYIVEIARMPSSGSPDFTDARLLLVDPPALVSSAVYSGSAEPETLYAWRVSAQTAGCVGASSGAWLFRTGGGSQQLVAVAQGMTAAEASQAGSWHDGPLFGKAQLSVLLRRDASIERVGFPIVGQRWDFGDSTPPDETASPTHIYAWPAGYRVHLELRDAEVAAADELQILAMDAQGRVPPQVDAAVLPTRGEVGQEFTFESRVLEGDAPVQMLLWDFGDQQRSNQTVVGHAYEQPGTYIVRLSAVDANGLVGEDFVAVTITDAQGAEAPTVRLYGVTQLIGEPPLDVRLLCDAQGAVGGAPHYSWDFGDGVTDDTSNAALVSHTYAVGADGEREYAPRCTVSNGALSSSDRVIVSLTDGGRLPPRIVSEPALQACAGEPYAYNEGRRAVARGTPELTWRAGKVVAGAILGAPAGFSVDPSTGVIEWWPSEEQVGVHAVSLVVENDVGHALQEFEIAVEDCGSPSAPSARASCGCRSGAWGGWGALLAVLAFWRRRSGAPRLDRR